MNTDSNTLYKLIDKICEYRYMVRNLALKAEKDCWKEDRLYNEIENISIDIDKLIHIYKDYKNGLCNYSEVEKFVNKIH